MWLFICIHFHLQGYIGALQCVAEVAVFIRTYRSVNFLRFISNAKFRLFGLVSMKLCCYPSGLSKGGSIVPSNPNLPPKHCSRSLNASVSYVSGSVCDSTVRFRRMSWNKALPSSLLYRDALLTNEHGTSRVPWEFMRLTHNRGWMVTVILGQNYNFSFDNAPHLTNISYRYSWVRK